MSNPLLDYYRKPNPMRDRLSGGRERVFPTKHPMVKAEDGFLKQAPATAADFMKASRYQRRNLLRK